jgi:hypothetical protein
MNIIPSGHPFGARIATMPRRAVTGRTSAVPMRHIPTTTSPNHPALIA